jgi:hypothetical protein
MDMDGPDEATVVTTTAAKDDDTASENALIYV